MMKLVNLWLVALALPTQGQAADPRLCALWSREVVRIEISTGRPALFELDGAKQIISVSLVDKPDPDMQTLTEDAILLRMSRLFSLCLLQETEEVHLPRNDESNTQAWVAAMRVLMIARSAEIANAGTEPASIGDAEWQAQCAGEYSTWDAETGTVIRKGSPERVRCPCGGEVDCEQAER